MHLAAGTASQADRSARQFRLLNDWQRGFPLCDEPFAHIAADCRCEAQDVLSGYRHLLARGAISRIGGIWGTGAGGAALLCALAVPAHRLDTVAAQVSAQPGVNHNYEREHHHNLWFVVTGRNAVHVAQIVDRIEAITGLTALRLRMQRAYRIDLGFDLRNGLATRGPRTPASVAPIEEADISLAALLEAGLPLVEQPYRDWAEQLNTRPSQVQATLQRWLAQGSLRRLGVIVRHHEAGFKHNAMTVFNVPDDRVDHCGDLLATQVGVTLAYRRERAEGWPYNLYCMVHGQDRGTVLAAINSAKQRCGLAEHAHAVLFSRRRFKQIGARYFGASESSPHVSP